MGGGGGGGGFAEFLCDVTLVASRSHRLSTGDTKRRHTSRPPGDWGNGLIRAKARKLPIGRLLVKADHILSHVRSMVALKVAYSAERTLTNNNEQKEVIRSWGTGGDAHFQEKRAGDIVRSASDILGMEQQGITTL